MPMNALKTVIISAMLALLPTLSVRADVALPCPDKPNCVSSQAQGSQYIAPLKMEGTTQEETKNKLMSILHSWPRTKIINHSGNTIEAIVTSRWMGFEDDLKLIINDNNIDVRSFSYSGYYDFGVNRKRVEQLRAATRK